MAQVTVCIPAYRAERWLGTGLRSLQRQVFGDFHVLVGIEPVDAEPTVRICETFASDARFEHYVNDRRLGWGGNVRALLRRVETPFFLILFHDDWLHSRYISTLLPPLLERPDASVCYGDIRRFGRASGRKRVHLRDGSPAEQLLDFFLARADGVAVRGVTRSTVLQEAGFPTNEFDDLMAESEWTLRLLVRGRAIHVPRALYLKQRVPDDIVSVSEGWVTRMEARRLRAGLEHNRRQMLALLAEAPLDDRERVQVTAAAEAAFFSRYVQFARGRFSPRPENRERAAWALERAASLPDQCKAQVRALVETANAAEAAARTERKRRPRQRSVAVIGAGIQGVCAALELAGRGYRVTLLERRKHPLDAASRWNEGKVHLGYLWAADTSLRTARQMIHGSLHFSKEVERLIGREIPEEWLSEPFVYGVPHASRLGPDELRSHFDAVDGLLRQELSRNGGSYFGRRDLAPVHEVDVDEHFDPTAVRRAFSTPERAIDPHRVADALSARVLEHPDISFRGKQRVIRVAHGVNGIRLWTTEAQRRFDAVVNAAGSSRIALDRTVGLEPTRRWLHRYKLAAYVPVQGVPVPSVTLVHGPFGDVVRFEGELYVSWYPVCRVAMTGELELPEPRVTRSERLAIARASWDELSSFVPALRHGRPDWDRAGLGGGHIPAWGESDVDDPRSELHERFKIGVVSAGAYHSVDPGKYGMAPLYARAVADRIDGLP